MNPYEMILKKTETLLGKGTAVEMQKAFEHPELRAMLEALQPGGTTNDGVKATQSLGAIVGGKEDKLTLPRPLSIFLMALRLTLSIDPNLTVAKARRPKIKGYPEMLEELADALEQFGGMVPMFSLTPDTLREKATRFRLLRKITKRLGDGALCFQANLTEEEAALFDVVKREYDLARPYALANAELRAALEHTEAFLYDAARQGAETNKARQADAEERIQKAQSKGTERAEAAAQARMAERLRGMVDQMDSTPDEDDAPPPKSTRKTPR